MSETSDSTRAVLDHLEILRHEHHLLLSSSIDDDDEKRASIEKSSESIDLGIEEALVTLQLENYFEHVDSETQKLILQVQRLTQENNWLRDELSLTEKQLQSSAQFRDDYQRDIGILTDELESIPTSTNDHLKLDDTLDVERDMPMEINQRTSPPPTTMTPTTNSEMRNHSEIPPRFRTLHNLVIQYAQAGRYEVAVPLCRQALEDLEKTHGHTHPDVATMLNILALVYRDQNKFKEALQLLTEALQIREKTLGLEHPAVAATLNNLAVLYGKKNRYKDAEPLCKRALDIRERCFGTDHPDVGKQLNNLALLCLNQGKYDKVEEYYKRAIDIYAKHYGQHDPNVIKTRNNLASAYLREGKYKLASQLYQQVLAESQMIFNEQCSTSSQSARDCAIVVPALKNLSALCRRQGFYEQADELESCTMKFSDHPSNAIQRALNLLRNIRIQDENPHELMRRSQQSAPTAPDYGRLRRSGSFQKLRQSIRRGSEKLVQKLRGTPTNPLPSLLSMQFPPSDQPMKRASSMSVLHHAPLAYPLQQQQTNRTSSVTHSIEQPSDNKQSSMPIGRDRLASAENLH